jgi:hypothetical protein
MTKKKEERNQKFLFSDRPTAPHGFPLCYYCYYYYHRRKGERNNRVIFFPSVGVVVEISQTTRDKSVATFSTLFGRVNSLLLHYTRLSGNLLPPALNFISSNCDASFCSSRRAEPAKKNGGKQKIDFIFS